MHAYLAVELVGQLDDLLLVIALVARHHHQARLERVELRLVALVQLRDRAHLLLDVVLERQAEVKSRSR